jgi:hypothetical protein
MGLIGSILGRAGGVSAVGSAVQSVAEVFRPNSTKALELSAQAQMAAMDGFAAEFTNSNATWFDSLINGLNRLPRPALALGTVGLFAYAMIDPQGFSSRMVGLNAVPEPLWWLLGAVVAFYFGARETHYFRTSRTPSGRVILPPLGAAPQHVQPENPATDLAAQSNPALLDWRAGQ